MEFRALTLGVTTLLIALTGCGSDKQDPVSSQPSNSPDSSQHVGGYSITQDDYHSTFKRTVEVQLDERMTEAQLQTIAKQIKQGASNDTDRTFIGYRIDGNTAGAYWATTHYEPELSVRIIGMNEAQAAEAKAMPVSQFETVSEMIEEFSDYSESNDTYRLVSEEPLHIHLLPGVFAGDSESVVTGELQRALIYGIYKTFVHTNADEVHVTSTPLIMTFSPISRTPADTPRLDITISREDALAAVQTFLDIEDLTELVKIEVGDGHKLETWSSDFTNLYYQDRTPGLEKFFATLAAQPAQ